MFSSQLGESAQVALLYADQRMKMRVISSSIVIYLMLLGTQLEV